MEQNSQGDVSLKAEEKINHEKNVSDPVRIVFAKPNKRVFFIVYF